MKIDFRTGKVIYRPEDYLNEDPKEVAKSLEKLKIIDEEESKNEPTFSYTLHKGLPYGRIKYMFYCFLLLLDGLIGIISIGQTQSVMANKYLMTKWIMRGYENR